MQTIVVGYDGSDHADRALSRAMDIAKAMGAPLRVVSSVKIVAGAHPRGGVSPLDPGDVEETEAAIEKARGIIAGSGLDAEVIEGRGDPADVLVQEAEATGADLIVVGTRGASGATRWLIGSVSTKVVHHAPCDVLVVR
jgi:nucleotide-binding universal stress UspA family protein